MLRCVVFRTVQEQVTFALNVILTIDVSFITVTSLNISILCASFILCGRDTDTTRDARATGAPRGFVLMSFSLASPGVTL